MYIATYLSLHFSVFFPVVGGARTLLEDTGSAVKGEVHTGEGSKNYVIDGPAGMQSDGQYRGKGDTEVDISKTTLSDNQFSHMKAPDGIVEEDSRATPIGRETHATVDKTQEGDEQNTTNEQKQMEGTAVHAAGEAKTVGGSVPPVPPISQQASSDIHPKFVPQENNVEQLVQPGGFAKQQEGGIPGTDNSSEDLRGGDL